MNFLSMFDNASLVGFYSLSFVAIFASLRVIMLANPVHAILSMIVSLLAVAGIFFILGAPFAGALQVIVYAGAILVLFVFVIMMLNLGVSNDARESRWLAAEVWAVPTGLSIIIAIVLYSMLGMGSQDDTLTTLIGAAPIGVETVSPKAVGVALFSEYLLLVEVAALLLLGALVAAYHIGKRALDDENISHSSQKIGTGADSVIEYDNDDLTDAVKYAKPYEYSHVNPQDYKSKSKSKSNPTFIAKSKTQNSNVAAQETPIKRPNMINKEGL